MRQSDLSQRWFYREVLVRREIEADEPANLPSERAEPVDFADKSRAARLALLRSGIEDGSYRVDAGAIASKLMDRLIDARSRPAKKE